MSRSIDERVVEMRFDNQQFEANARSTLNTLQRLKEALNFTKSKESLNQLSTAAKNTNMDQLVQSVTALQKRFSTFGIISMRAIENVTDSMMGLASRGVKAVNDSIVSGGIRRAMNIENAHFQLQALLKDEEKVQKVMQNAMDSVTDTAYGYDEAAKAASMFAASGLKAGKEMERALAGITGVAAMTNSEYEYISQIFTTVAGNGRLMGDQLLQLSARGLNAASTIKDYYKEVKGQTKMTEQDIRDMVSKGEISFKTFAEAMNWAFGDSAKRANETFNGALSNMKAALARIGAEFVSPLVAQNSEVVKLFNTLQKKIDVVKKALTFSDEEKGIVSLSKRVTDLILSLATATRHFVADIDLTDAFKALYNLVDVFVNVAKAAYRILMPLGKTFAQVFLKDLNFKNLEKVTAKLKSFTAGMKLSWKSSKNLHDTYKGLFDIVKLLGDALFQVLKAILPINKPVRSLGEVLLEVTGAIGRTLSAFAAWISKSKQVSKAYETTGLTIRKASTGLSSLIIGLAKFVKYVAGLEQTQQIIQGIAMVFGFLGMKGAQYLGIAAEKAKVLGQNLKVMIPEFVKAAITVIVKKVQDLQAALKSIDLSKPTEAIKKFADGMKEMLGMAKGNEGIKEFTKNMNEFKISAKSAFSFTSILDKVKAFKDTLGGFVTWFKENVVPLFSSVSVGGVISAGSAIGMVYSIIKMAKAIEGVSTAIKNVPNVFKTLDAAVKAYMKDVDSKVIIKIAGAIVILAAALTILSFCDTKRLLGAAVALSLVAAVFLIGTAKLMDSLNKSQELKNKSNNLTSVLRMFAKRLSFALDDLVKAVRLKMIGSMVKDFGIAIATIVGSIVILAKLYKKDSESVDAAVGLLGKVVATMVGVVALLVILQKAMGKGIKNSMIGPALSVLALSMALSLAIRSLKKLFKIELPGDWKKKLAIMAGIFGVLGIVAIALGRASKSASGAKIKGSPLIAAALAMVLVVRSVEKLFKMTLPEDYKTKLGIIGGIFAALAALMYVLGDIKGGKGGLGGAAALLAMCVTIGAIVMALGVLMIFPGKQLKKAATALGACLVTLGVALYGASKTANASAAKAILGMALIIGAIVAALAILGVMPLANIAKAGATMGAMLLLLALNFNQIGKISGESTWKSVAAMALIVAGIALSLVALATLPWQGLVAAGAAMGMVLLSLSHAFKTIAENNPEISQLLKFGVALASLIAIVIAIQQLANYPWEGLLAGGASISMVLLAMSAAFAVISNCKPNLSAIALFVLATAAILGIGFTLSMIADQGWQGLLASAAAISVVLLAMSAAMAICAVVGGAAPAAIAGMALLAAFVLGFSKVLELLGYLFKSDGAQQLLAGGAAVLVTIGQAIGDFVGAIVGSVLTSVSESLIKVGENLSAFIQAAKPFFDGINGIDEGAMNGVKMLAQAILILTATDFITGIMNFMGLGGGTTLSTFGRELVAFAPSLAAFAAVASNIDSSAVEGAASAAKILVSLSKDVPLEGGLLGAIIGNKMSLAKLGPQLVKFGQAMSDFAKSTNGITSDSVQQAADAGKILTSLAKTAPSDGGLIGKLFGSGNMETMGTQLVAFGKAMSQFSSSISGVNASKIDSVTTSMNKFIKMAGKANSTSSEGLKNLSKSMNSVSETSSSDYSKNLAGKASSAGDAMKNLINAAVSTAQKESAKFKKEGAAGGDKYADGIKSKNSKAKTSGRSLVTNAVSGARSLLGQFETSGKNAGEGYARGLRSKLGSVKAAASDLAKASQAALKAANQEHSPSKIFRQSGIFAGMGYVIGMGRMMSKVYQAGAQLGDESLKGIERGVMACSEVFDETSISPIITPTVDLRRVESSVGSMYGMFNEAINMTARAAGAIDISNRSEVSDLADALRDFAFSDENRGGNTYNINGVNYEEGSNVGEAIKTIVGAVTVQRRV